MNTPQKILVVKRDALGDLISVTPFLEVVRRNWPAANISFVVGDWSRAALKNNPHLNHLIVVNSRAWLNPIGKFWRRHALVRQLRPERFDTVFILQGPAPFRFWEKFAQQIGAANRIGFRAWGAKTSLTSSVQLPRHHGHVFQELKKNRAEMFLDLLRCLGVRDTSNSGNRLYWQPADDKFAADFLRRNSLSGHLLVALAPGGASNPGLTQLGKRWPLENYTALAAEILKNPRTRLIIIGGPTDRFLAEKLISGLPAEWRHRVASAAGQSTVHQSAAIIARAKVFVGNDSGPLHIASATKTPIVGIFGPTNPVVDGPYHSAGVNLFHPGGATPCYTKDCAGHSPCIARVTVSEVISAVNQYIN